MIEIDEFNEDKNYLNSRIKDIETKIKEEQELEQYNFTFEDIMLKRDLASIKELNSPYYRNMFKIKWNELSIKEKQDLMMSYIDTIEVIKTDKDIKIKNINFRKTFIEEYANLFNNGGINRYQEIEVNGEIRQVEISKPMTRNEVMSYKRNYRLNFLQLITKKYKKKNIMIINFI